MPLNMPCDRNVPNYRNKSGSVLGSDLWRRKEIRVREESDPGEMRVE
jgi:hypothetical protein